MSVETHILKGFNKKHSKVCRQKFNTQRVQAKIEKIQKFQRDKHTKRNQQKLSKVYRHKFFNAQTIKSKTLKVKAKTPIEKIRKISTETQRQTH